MNYKFSIFSSTFNAEKFIYRLFDSVSHQTYKNFEWILFDDASKDKTVDLIKEFIIKNPEIDCKFYSNKINQGVKANRKNAISLASGDFFITWDHDDIQCKDQLEYFNDLLNEYDSPKLGNIMASMKNQNGNFVGKPFEKDLIVSTYIKQFSFMFNNNNECMVCNKLSVIKSYPVKDLKYGIPYDSAFLYATMGLKYETIFTNKVVRTYFQNQQTHSSLSNQGRSKNSEQNFTAKSAWINEFLPLMNLSFKNRVRFYFGHVLYGLISKKSFLEILSTLDRPINKVITVFLFPLAYLFLSINQNKNA